MTKKHFLEDSFTHIGTQIVVLEDLAFNAANKKACAAKRANKNCIWHKGTKMLDNLEDRISNHLCVSDRFSKTVEKSLAPRTLHETCHNGDTDDGFIAYSTSEMTSKSLHGGNYSKISNSSCVKTFAEAKYGLFYIRKKCEKSLVTANTMGSEMTTKGLEKHKRECEQLTMKKSCIEEPYGRVYSRKRLKNSNLTVADKMPLAAKHANESCMFYNNTQATDIMEGRRSKCLPVSGLNAEKQLNNLALGTLHAKNKNSGIENELVCFSILGTSKVLCVGDYDKLSNISLMKTTAEDQRYGKVYCRKKWKKQLGILNATYSVEKTNDVDRNLTPEDSIEDADCEEVREICISTLLNSGLLLRHPKTQKVKHPGVVGDNTSQKPCKVCSRSENRTSWICDSCEKMSHENCCKATIKYNGWYCSTCLRERRSDIIIEKVPMIGSRYAYFLSQIWNANACYTSQVRIGIDYQADIPEYKRNFSDTSNIQFLGETVPSDEVEKEIKKSEMR